MTYFVVEIYLKIIILDVYISINRNEETINISGLNNIKFMFIASKLLPWILLMHFYSLMLVMYISSIYRLKISNAKNYPLSTMVNI